MKIDAVLARHPWPWRVVCGICDGWWEVLNAKNETVFDDGSAAGESTEECDAYTRDAILELVEAHVARTTRVATHSEECWKWHLDCAVRKVDELSAAASDILLSFTAGTECRIPHHQVERLFKAAHGKDAKTPWEDGKETKQ